MITLYNSQSRKVEEFIPALDVVTMYVCGPTVYGRAHIGNARPAIVFDQLYRVLVQQYGNVLYARNITDVDDKIIKAANDQQVPITQITDTATVCYHDDLEALNCLPPFAEPKATDNIDAMIAMIKGLIQQDHAYQVDGEVFFHVPSNTRPGLANHQATETVNRVEVDPRKKDPRDFVLWKPAKTNEPYWYSPWGNGRPGWHIECSAMIGRLFGSYIDIHGGGSDLRFPHHEAECAQSSCYYDTDKPVGYWMHNGLLTVNGEKMSKSRGNIIMLDELFEQVPAEAVRYYFLRTHYRSPMDFTKESLAQANAALDGLYETLYRHDDLNWAEDAEPAPEVLEALHSDLNTPLALSHLHQLATRLDREEDKAVTKAQLLASGKLLGLFSHTPHQWRTFGVDKEEVERLIGARIEARQSKDYAEADRIRQHLLAMGITLADGAHGTEWRRL